MTISRRVLIAASQSSTRLWLAQALSGAGCEVRSTAAAGALLRWALEGGGDLVIADADDGAPIFDLVKELRRRRPELPIILIGFKNDLLTAINAARAHVFD